MSEELAKQFHEIYERLAPSFGYETRIDTREFDPNSKNGKLMIAVTDEIERKMLARAERAEQMVEKLIQAGQDMRYRLYAYDDFDPIAEKWADLLYRFKNEGA